MFVEHAFTTTLGADAATRAASEFLALRGFVVVPQNRFQIDDESWKSVECHRGRRNLIPKEFTQFSQFVRLEWDRGRVSFAMTVYTEGANRLSRTRRIEAMERELLIAIAAALELLLAEQVPPSEAAADWERIERDLCEATRRNARRMWIGIGIYLASIAAICSFAFWWFSRR
jgi:hypothetical protein